MCTRSVLSEKLANMQRWYVKLVIFQSRVYAKNARANSFHHCFHKIVIEEFSCAVGKK